MKKNYLLAVIDPKLTFALHKKHTNKFQNSKDECYSNKMLARVKIMEISSLNLHSCPNVEFKVKLRIGCRNPTLAKCEGEAQHLEKVGIWSPLGLPNVQSSTAKPKIPRIGVFLVSLERS